MQLAPFARKKSWLRSEIFVEITKTSAYIVWMDVPFELGESQ